MLSATAFAAFPSQTSSAGSTVTITRAESQKLINKINVANAQILVLVRIAQITPWNDVKWLLEEVDDIIADVKAYAVSIGTDIGCEYTLYIIDGQKVWVDPILYIPVVIFP
jgi:hypothetical protein